MQWRVAALVCLVAACQPNPSGPDVSAPDPGAQAAGALSAPPVTSAPLLNPGSQVSPQGNDTLQIPGVSADAGAAPVAKISDEQDFAAVSKRESIASDKERLAEQRAAYVQIQPTSLPPRPGASDTVVLDFALSTTNALGQKVYDRGRPNQAAFYRACAKYGSQDAAQEEFLTSGGPQRDRRGVDPDGDGFACYWDPTPFRQARLGAGQAPVVREVLPGSGATDILPGDENGKMVRTSDYDKTPIGN